MAIKDKDKKWYHIKGLSDKQMHFAVGVLIALVTMLIFDYAFAIIAVLAIGGAKEINDLMEHGEADLKDFFATVAGGAAAIIILLIINYLS